jgi:hypothetical protein
MNYRQSSASCSKSSGSASNRSSESENNKYKNLPDTLIQFIMIEYSHGYYNSNWLKFYFEN